MSALSENEIKKLLAAAEKARANAYAPYSGFCVGAALLFDGGETVSGCNVENGSYGLSMCAERSAMVSAVAKGLTHPLACAVAGPNDVFCPPCGACRQFLAEFAPDMEIILKGPDGPECFSLRQMLPYSFTLDRE